MVTGTPNATSTPIANLEIVNASSVPDNYLTGIQAAAVTNTISYNLTNRIPGDLGTVGATTANIIVFDTTAHNLAGVAGVYDISVQLCGFDLAGLFGATYNLEGTIVADGLGGLRTAGTPVRIMDGDPEFNVNQVTITLNLGQIVCQATGIAGRTINWTGIMTYVFGGAT